MMDQPPIKKTQNVEHQGNDFLCPPRQETDEVQALRIILRMAEAVSQCISQEETCKRIINIFIE
ncbi:MAG: hypothetical protein U9N19_04490, partial [Thermodesulfobacteriota bacterium]|nr:hypothetical protein [Thermodesulfobacteriota bacterium]